MRASQSGRSGRPASTNRLNSCCCVSFPVLHGSLHNHPQHSRPTCTLSYILTKDRRQFLMLLQRYSR